MGAKLVGFTTLDLRTFLPIMKQALDRNIAASGDSVDADPPLHHMLCVAGIKDEDARPTVEVLKNVSQMFHAAFLVVCDERDTSEVLEVASMPAVVTPTCKRGVDCILLTSTIDKWIDVVHRGCQPAYSSEVRKIYNSIYSEFCRVKLEKVFESRRKPQSDSTFLLEYIR